MVDAELATPVEEGGLRFYYDTLPTKPREIQAELAKAKARTKEHLSSAFPAFLRIAYN